MKNSKRKLFAIILTIAMIVHSSLIQWVSSDGVQDVYAQENETNAVESVSMGQEQLEVSGNNGVGSLLAKEINGELTEQQENQGYTIFDVTVEGKMATVSFDVIEDCRLIAGIYSEDGKDLLASGVIDVEKTAKDAVVTLETKEMPQYFLVKAFLVDETMSPLCSVYQSELYTKEMQEFLTKTTDDFEQDKILNLDEDKTNNFAVYKDSVKKIEKENNKNIVVSANDETGVYVLENIDSTIKNLKNGDIFAYTYDGQELIVKVDSVVVNGTTATIYSQETALDEVFDYVKIDNTGDLSDATVDTSSLDEDVVYNGLVEDTNEAEAYSEEGIMPQEEIEGWYGTSFSYTIKEKKFGDEDNYAKVSSNLKLSAEAKIKVYITDSYQYLEVKLDYSMKISLKITGQGGGKLELGTIGMAICPGVYLEFTPSFVVQAKIEIELSGKLGATIGFRYSSDDGLKNISSAPKWDSQLKIEGTLFIGLSLEPKFAIISEKIAKVGIETEFGVELKATMDSKDDNTENIKHKCGLCIDGELTGKANVSVNIKFLNNDKWSLNKDIGNLSHKICDFYYSLTFDKYGIGKCPYYQYKVTIDVCNSGGQKLGNVKIAINGQEYETDNQGHAEIFLNEGTAEITLSKQGYKMYKKDIEIDGKAIELDKKAKEIFIILLQDKDETTGDGGDEGNGGTGDNNNEDKEQGTLEIQRQTVSLGGSGRYSAAITKEGVLYLWGDNDGGRLGNGTTKGSSIPIKIMENVESVSLGYGTSAAITKEGALYLWGWHVGEQCSSVPIKIMENVASVNLDVESVSLGEYHSAAITKEGSLYLWGRNGDGQLGNGTNEKSLTPIKIMDNVESVSLGEYHSAAITKEGSLYLWGYNDHGQLGNGTYKDSSTPIKIMDNVASVSLGGDHSAAITKEGSLYLWGRNGYGQLGNGTYKDSSTPIKIMDNVKLPSSAPSTRQATFSEQTYTSSTYSRVALMDNQNNQIMPTALDTISSSFTNLTPNVEYIFYIVKSEETGKDLLSADNILYINQGKADENGNLAFDFNNKTEWTNVKTFLIGGVGDGNITLDDMELICSIAPETTVEQLKEKLHKRFQLVDSDNIEITDNKSFIQSGNILCLFDSKGEIAKRYTICIIGDVNKDGIINIQDAVILKRRLAGYSNLRLSEKASDINGDGVLNIRDAVILLKYCAGMNVQLGKQ